MEYLQVPAHRVVVVHGDNARVWDQRGTVLVYKQIADRFLGDESVKLLHGLTFGGHPAAATVANANNAIAEVLDQLSWRLGTRPTVDLRTAPTPPSADTPLVSAIT
jgi:adenosylmethionine-8-amino-7-oxononanoate aminotransferase